MACPIFKNISLSINYNNRIKKKEIQMDDAKVNWTPSAVLTFETDITIIR